MWMLRSNLKNYILSKLEFEIVDAKISVRIKI